MRSTSTWFAAVIPSLLSSLSFSLFLSSYYSPLSQLFFLLSPFLSLVFSSTDIDEENEETTEGRGENNRQDFFATRRSGGRERRGENGGRREGAGVGMHRDLLAIPANMRFVCLPIAHIIFSSSLLYSLFILLSFFSPLLSPLSPPSPLFSLLSPSGSRGESLAQETS